MRRTAQKRIASRNQVAGKNAAPKGSSLASKRTGSPGHFRTFANDCSAAVRQDAPQHLPLKPTSLQ